jgi:hypothetical protein
VEDGATYQLEMMRSLREVNVDNNTVGWYQSTYMGAYQSVELIDTFLQYQVSRSTLEKFFRVGSTLAEGYSVN